MAKLFEFSFNMGSLSTYTKEVSDKLLVKAVMGGNTAQIVNIMPNVKGSENINWLDSTLDLNVATCGWNVGTSTTIPKKVTMSVVELELKEALCERTLNNYWLGQKLRPGSANDQIPFEDVVLNKKMTDINNNIDFQLWVGNAQNTAATYSHIDGYYTLLSGNTNRVHPSTISGITITVDNAIDIVNDVVLNFPEAILNRQDLKIFASYANFMKIVQAWRDVNNYNYSNVDGTMNSWRFMIPGTSVELIAILGLQGTNHLIATYAENLYLGTDVLDEMSGVDAWYSQDNDEIRLKATFKIGAQILFPEFVVTNF